MAKEKIKINKKMFVYKGEQNSLKYFCDKYGLKYATAARRMYHQDRTDEMCFIIANFDTEIHNYKRFKGTFKEIAHRFNMSYSNVLKEFGAYMPIDIVMEYNDFRNHVYEVNGFKGTLKDISVHFGIPYRVLAEKLNNLIPLEEAVVKDKNYYKPKYSTPVAESYTVNGFTGNLIEIAEHFNVKEDALRSRICLGWDIETALFTPFNIKQTRSPHL